MKDIDDKIIAVTDERIDTARLVAITTALEADGHHAAVGDDNRNGWAGLRPNWRIHLSMGADTYWASIIRLVRSGLQEESAVIVKPELPRDIALPQFDRRHEVYCKHQLSQLRDCPFQLGFRDADAEVWVTADWLDTALLETLLGSRNAEGERRIAPNARVTFAMRGHVFRVDRSGASLVLIPSGARP